MDGYCEDVLLGIFIEFCDDVCFVADAGDDFGDDSRVRPGSGAHMPWAARHGERLRDLRRRPPAQFRLRTVVTIRFCHSIVSLSKAAFYRSPTGLATADLFRITGAAAFPNPMRTTGYVPGR